jgi:hypothetical protein
MKDPKWPNEPCCGVSFLPDGTPKYSCGATQQGLNSPHMKYWRAHESSPVVDCVCDNCELTRYEASPAGKAERKNRPHCWCTVSGRTSDKGVALACCQHDGECVKWVSFAEATELERQP